MARKYLSKTTATSEDLLNAIAGKQITVQTLKITLKGTSTNEITIKDGSEIIDFYSLQSQGQVEGFMLNRSGYILNGALNVTASTTSEVIFYCQYEQF